LTPAESPAAADVLRGAPACRVALTGASGFVGRHLLERMLAEGFQVRALWRSAGAPAQPGLEICAGALESPAALARLVCDCDAVVHVAAAIRGRSAAEFDEVNIAGTRRLAEAVAAHAPRARLVALSSLAAREPGLSWYAASKAAGEAVLLSSGQDWAILRPPAVYGPGDPALAPLWRALARGWLPRLGPPAARFSLLYVDDLVEAVMRLMALGRPIRGVLPLHDGREAGYSWPEVARIGAARRGARVRTVPVPRALLGAIAELNLRSAGLRGASPMLTPAKLRELVHPDWTCDNSGLEAALGWSPRATLETCLPRLPGWERHQ
jgi:2-alkyl-3-oxoalkanoate reductase